jgi:hypothetical protein
MFHLVLGGKTNMAASRMLCCWEETRKILNKLYNIGEMGVRDSNGNVASINEKGRCKTYVVVVGSLTHPVILGHFVYEQQPVSYNRAIHQKPKTDWVETKTGLAKWITPNANLFCRRFLLWSCVGRQKIAWIGLMDCILCRVDLYYLLNYIYITSIMSTAPVALWGCLLSASAVLWRQVQWHTAQFFQLVPGLLTVCVLLTSIIMFV